MKFLTKTAAGCAVSALCACTTMGLSGIEDTSASEDLLPPNAEQGACYGHEIRPAVFETVTQHVVAREATYDDKGRLLTPTAYRTDTVQKMVRDRDYVWFKKPCPQDMDDQFVASVQRALKARGLYAGQISGEYDQRTRRAIRKFQKPLGIDSGTLSLDAARKLGLVAVERQKAKSDS